MVGSEQASLRRWAAEDPERMLANRSKYLSWSTFLNVFLHDVAGVTTMVGEKSNEDS